MVNAEKKVIDFLSKNILFIGAIFFSVIAIWARVSSFGFLSRDMYGFLQPWCEELSSFGTAKEALTTQVGDYNVAYQTLLYLITMLPGTVVSKIKILSCVFDYALALLICVKIKQYTADIRKALIAYIVILGLPTVIINSSIWGQCDSIYSFFSIYSIFSLYERKYKKAFILWGLSFAFKLQAVFIAPVFIVLYLKRKDFSIIHFLLTPLTMMISEIPNVICGRSIWSVFEVYAGQVKESGRLTYYYPNIWNLFCSLDHGTDAISAINDWFQSVPMACTMAGLIIYAFYMSKVNWDKSIFSFILGALIGTFIGLMFLPAMHERYGYLIEISIVILAFLRKECIPIAILIQLSGVLSYRVHLVELPLPDWTPLLNIIAFVALVVLLVRELKLEAFE